MFKKRSCYIITKPLQYINATNIEDINTKDCYITDTFLDAKNFANEISRQSNHWNNVYFVTSKHIALKEIFKKKSEYINLYLDSDIGIYLRLFLSLLYPIKVYVYEEGLASYLPKVREKNKNNYLKFIIDYFLGENWSGGSFRTKSVYLYHPNAFKSLVGVNKKTILPFKQPFLNHLASLSDIRTFYNPEKVEIYKGKKILLYLMSWTLNQQYEDIYNKYPDFVKIIKIHPHVRNESISKDLLHFDFYPDSRIPSELLIAAFIEIAEKLVIIHEGTAAMLNFNNNKISEYNIATIKYSNLYKKIKKEFEREELNEI